MQYFLFINGDKNMQEQKKMEEKHCTYMYIAQIIVDQ